MIHCNECEFFNYKVPKIWDSVHFPPECRHPNNKGTWLSKEDLKDSPWIINKDMDCKWFKRKT